jgi:hypothetical protein
MDLIFSSRHVGVAAEAFVAGQFARLGYDVSVRYGANQPEYDLVVASGERMLKVSVKGSKDGSWGLTPSNSTASACNRLRDKRELGCPFNRS